MICRIVHDGTHYVAHAPGGRPYANWQRRPKKPHEIAFRDLYRGTKMGLVQSSKDGVTYTPGMAPKEQKAYILTALQDTFGAIEDWDQFIDREFEREKQNFYARAKRFRRKAMLNPWNYFVTFTYDSELTDEYSFKAKLRRALSNLHSRNGWCYMGAFERSPSGRLHFHGLFQIPPGQMVGNIYECQDYSTKTHRMQISHINTWFEARFGRNDFAPISMDDIRRGPTLDYVLKYIEKTGERIIYSRGIPSDLVEEIGYDQCVCEFFNFVRKWVLYDDWKTVRRSSSDVLEGDDALEWLICFAEYEYENYTATSEPVP